jgi:hypothetical protein
VKTCVQWPVDVTFAMGDKPKSVELWKQPDGDFGKINVDTGF